MEKIQFKGVPDSNWVVGPCITEEIAKQVLAVAHAYGWKWEDGDSYLKTTEWIDEQDETCYRLSFGQYDKFEYYSNQKYTIISPETFLANNPMPEEKPEEKTRKPGVKYTLEDWKKESDANRKRAEYWRNKCQASEKTANIVGDSLTKVLETHQQLQLENKLLKDANTELKCEKDFLDSDRNDVRHTLDKLKLDLDHTNKNYLILQTANKVLKESNENLRNSNDQLFKSSTEAKQELGFAKLKIQDLEKEWDSCIKELKTVKGHFELQTKGVKALEEDARNNRLEIGLLKDTIENRTSELKYACNAHNDISDKYNKLRNEERHTRVLAWAGWIMFFVALFGLLFFKG